MKSIQRITMNLGMLIALFAVAGGKNLYTKSSSPQEITYKGKPGTVDFGGNNNLAYMGTGTWEQSCIGMTTVSFGPTSIKGYPLCIVCTMTQSGSTGDANYSNGEGDFNGGCKPSDTTSDCNPNACPS